MDGEKTKALQSESLLHSVSQTFFDEFSAQWKPNISLVMAANAVGFVTCINLLGNYDDKKPHLKGIGDFIFIFIIGLFLAIFAHVAIYMLDDALRPPIKRRMTYIWSFSVMFSVFVSALMIFSALVLSFFRFVDL